MPHVKGVHGVAHVVELAWADALKGEPLIDEMVETNQMAYVHYAGSGKKKLTYSAMCARLGEEQHDLISLHGIRWRESSYRSARNLLLSWHARTTDLLEEASVEIGLKLTPLSPPEAFLNIMFQKKTDAGEYGTGQPNPNPNPNPNANPNPNPNPNPTAQVRRRLSSRSSSTSARPRTTSTSSKPSTCVCSTGVRAAASSRPSTRATSSRTCSILLINATGSWRRRLVCCLNA